MPGGIGIGAAGQPDVVGVVRARREDLLAVDYVLVAVPDRSRGERGQVGTGSRLGVADREVHVAGQDAGQEHRLLLGRAELLQRGADRLQRHRWQRHVGPGRLAHEDLLLHLAEPAAAVLDRPSDPEPAVAAHPADQLLEDVAVPVGQHRLALGRRDQCGEVGPQFVPQRELLRGQVNEHGCSRSERQGGSQRRRRT